MKKSKIFFELYKSILPAYAHEDRTPEQVANVAMFDAEAAFDRLMESEKFNELLALENEEAGDIENVTNGNDDIIG